MFCRRKNRRGNADNIVMFGKINKFVKQMASSDESRTEWSEHKFFLTNIMFLLGLFASIPYIVLFGFLAEWGCALGLTFAGLISALSIFLHHTNKSKLAKTLFLITWNVTLVLFAFHLGARSRVDLFLVSCVTSAILAFDFKTERSYLYGFIIAPFCSFFALQYLNFAVSSIPVQPLLANSWVFSFINTAAFGLIILIHFYHLDQVHRKFATSLSATSVLLHDRSTLLRSVIDAVPGLVSVISRDEKYLLGNKSLLRALNITEKEFIGAPVGFMSEGTQFASLFRNFHLSSQNESSEISLFTIPGEIEPRWMYTSFNRVPALDASICITLDISDEIAMSEENALQRVALERTSRLAELGEMAASVAHEINNPLAIISLKIERIKSLLEKQQTDRAVLEKEIGIIDMSATRVIKIVKGMKTLSRRTDQDPMEAVPLSRIIETVLTLCQEKLRAANVDFRLLDYLDRSIVCRESEISQALINLISNSVDAVQDLPERWVELEFAEVGSNFEMRVTDSGKGIASEVLRKIMQPFFTTKKVGSGTGLGLSISKTAIESHNGKIDYDCLTGNTRFTIKLPLTNTEKIAS